MSEEIKDTQSVENLLDMLYQMVYEAKGSPLSGSKCVIDRYQALDMLSELRGQIPAELQNARELISRREEYVEKAKQEVRQTLERARQEARDMVSEDAVTLAAREKARKLVQSAEDRTREMYRVANEYSEDVLRRAEDAMQMALNEVRETRSRFREASNEQMKRKRSELTQTQTPAQDRHDPDDGEQ